MLFFPVTNKDAYSNIPYRATQLCAEAGGITQSVGAFTVKGSDKEDAVCGSDVVFLDTPVTLHIVGIRFVFCKLETNKLYYALRATLRSKT